MSQKSVFSIINVESAPQRRVSRADLSRAVRTPRPAPRPASRATARPAPPRSRRSWTLAGAAYERTLLLLVAASFTAFIGAYLLGTALEMLGFLLVPALVIGLAGFAASKIAAARRTAAGRFDGYAAVVDPRRQIAGR